MLFIHMAGPVVFIHACITIGCEKYATSDSQLPYNFVRPPPLGLRLVGDRKFIICARTVEGFKITLFFAISENSN